ncbi:hypothetical protein FF36_05686 [Frankia torreyi]|uniref:Uncharacterized protein n=1 Tax=Frankia torreyi TaxID=1856 RepID=A0A0D8B9G5_9ACTN|nr:hypothetical protein [Frankia torreyi]KJE20022.1 hypothetical protein FF36_05686 [Frankia torreyi]KQM02009.1 hypothetical protein FF86_10862 [Frankia sp. CpI1-P]
MAGEEPDLSCPSWCREPAGHLHLEPGGSGDVHAADVGVIDLPEVPGLRSDGSSIAVQIEQYVTRTATDLPLILLDFEELDSGDGREGLTVDDAEALIAVLRQAIALLRVEGS